MGSSGGKVSGKVNDIGWHKVLNHPHYRQQLDQVGFFRISAAKLKSISQREPRLMAKHDSTTARPRPFTESRLNIIALSRSEYLVGKFDLFAPFPADEVLGPIRYMPFPGGIESLDPVEISSEAAALNAAALSGILQDFLKEDALHATVAGRMSSGEFTVNLTCGEFTINKAQMEIDAGFESSNLLCLVEAKNHLSKDFNIRQLYFPFRRFSQQVSKSVVPVYQVYSNGIFRLYRFEFTDPLRPESIRLAHAARYTLTPSFITLDVIKQLLTSVTIAPEPAIPFPQADSFARVINLCEQLQPYPLSLEEITENYDFTSRQSHYYTSAAKYLGLASAVDGAWSLTEFGARVMAASPHERNLQLIEALLRHQIFHTVITTSLRNGEVPDKPAILDIMNDSGLKLGDSTIGRRAGTVQSWAQWVWDVATVQELEI